MRLSGGEAIVRMFQAYGVEYSFGMAGFQPLPYYDALARQDKIRHILIRDEKHGSFAADAYARVKRRPAIADATLGPGATNLISGAAESFGASIPQILLTAEVNSAIATRGATQESDQSGMLKPTSRVAIEVNQIQRIPELIRRAFTVANGGRPGPVHVNVPEEVFHGDQEFAESEFYVSDGTVEMCGRRTRPDASSIDRAVAKLSAAERPVMLIGGGVHLSGAYEAVDEFLRETGIPVANTISGKGAVSDRDPLAIGLFGRYSRFANEMIKRSDALLVVGCKLGEIATSRWELFESGTQIVHLDIDPGEQGRVYRTDTALTGDARLGLKDLTAAMQGSISKEKKTSWAREVAARRSEWLDEALPRYLSDEQPMTMPRLLHELRGAAPQESVVVADGGFAAHWSALLYDVTDVGRSYVANRGHAAIGYGLPGAIGAKLAAPDRTVIALTGDNGFAMAVAELETAKRIGAPVVVVVVNNAALGYVKALQHNMYEDRFLSVDFLDVNYADVARAFGCEGRRVHTGEELAISLKEAFDCNVPYVIDVMVTTDPAKMLPGIDSRTAAGS